jgi:hypothetical protein
MAVQNPPVKGGFEPPVMSFSGVVMYAETQMKENDGLLEAGL